MKNFILTPIQNYLSRLRFPQLFLLVTILFVADLIIPDFIPFIDELLLGLLTLLLGSVRRRKDPDSDVAP